MSEKICKNCKYFEKVNNDYIPYYCGFGHCNHSWYLERREIEVLNNSPTEPDVLFFEDFGCIHFEPKEKKVFIKTLKEAFNGTI